MKTLSILLTLFVSVLFTGCGEDKENPETDTTQRTFHHLCKEVFTSSMSESCVYPLRDIDLLCGSLSNTKCPTPENSEMMCEYSIDIYDKYVTKCQKKLNRNSSDYPFKIPENYSCDLENPQPLATPQQIIDEMKKINDCAWIFDTANQE